jgi:hypothetical protein
MMLEYSVTAKRLDDTGSEATANAARIILDTGIAGRPDTLNSAELLLASLAACMIKAAERVSPMIKFDMKNREVSMSKNAGFVCGKANNFPLTAPCC